jgi:hypothetical protein
MTYSSSIRKYKNFAPIDVEMISLKTVAFMAVFLVVILPISTQRFTPKNLLKHKISGILFYFF